MGNLLDALLALYPRSPYAVLVKGAIQKAAEAINFGSVRTPSEEAAREATLLSISHGVSDSFSEFVKAVGEHIADTISYTSFATTTVDEESLITVITVYEAGSTADFRHITLVTGPETAGLRSMRISIRDCYWDI